MKVFKKEETAKKSHLEKEEYFLNSVCPYTREDELCGSWCALFYFFKGVNNAKEKRSPHVIMGCKAGEKLLFVEEVVEE